LQAYRKPEAIPDVAHAAARMWMQDSIGVALSGASVPQSKIVLDVARSWGTSNEAHVWGSTETLPAGSAALMNAFNIHNQEFDCVHERAVVHPMAVILAALFAYSEKLTRMGSPVSGAKFTAALTLAVDCAAVIGMSATRAIRFFRPAQCGCLGAVAGICALADFDQTQSRDAFGLAYSQLSGTMQAHIEGTPALALQVGFAARAAVNAAELAARGFRGPHDILDGQHGYFALFETDAKPDAAFAELGKVWQITKVSHKPFPTGRAAQGGIAGLRYLMKTAGFSHHDVAQIVVAAPPLVRQLVNRPMQLGMNVSYARLCMPFLLAQTLSEGTVNLSAYSAANLSSQQLLALAEKVSMVADDNNDVNALRPQHITVTLKSGISRSHDLAYVYGAPEAPMSAEDQLQKFIHCAAFAPRPRDVEAATRLHTAIGELQQLPDVSTLLNQLAA
jgi:aconitate decarboxylase